VLDCAGVGRHLEAYHDGELPVADRVAVGHHLQDCPACASEADDLDVIASSLRYRSAGAGPPPADLDAMRDAILSRVQAERQVSWPVRIGQLFDDMHLVWAGLSATAATAACAALLFGIWFLSPPERADSLAGLLSALATPGSDRNPVSVDPRMRMPRVSDDALPAMLATTATEEDLVFALAAVVTREGRIARSEVLVSNHRDHDALLLMNAIAEARFQPARLRGSPVAVNLVWLLTHTTVRGKMHS
jgi:hypothetical protein